VNLPILGTLSALFTNANEELKKLLQPWALFSAAIFLIPSLFLIYQPLQHRGPDLGWWEDLSEVQQALIASGVLLSLAYLINSLSGLFLALAGGRWLRRSPVIGRVLIYQQWLAYDRLEKATKPRGTEKSNRAFYRLAYEYPTPVRLPQNGSSETPDFPTIQSAPPPATLAKRLRATDALALAPTRLANVRAAVSSYSMNQYGAHLDTIWPALEQTLGKEDENLLKRIDGEQTATTFLATVAVLLVVVAVVAVPVGVLVGDYRRLAWALLLLLVAYGTYRAAVVQALAWTRLIRAALDLHLDEAATRLGFRSLAGDPAAAHKRWEDVSLWLAYGGMKLDDPPDNMPQVDAEWYKEKASSSPTTVSASAGVTATARVVERTRSVTTGASASGSLIGPTYEVYVTAAWSGPATVLLEDPSTRVRPGGFVTIGDSRLPRLPAGISGAIHYPDGSEDSVTPIISRDNEKEDALVWRLPDLVRHGSLLLHYDVTPVTWLAVGPDVEREQIAPAASDPFNRLAIRLRYTGRAAGTVTLIALPVGKDSAGTSFHWRTVADAAGQPMTGQPRYDPVLRCAIWAINDVAPNSRLTLVVTLIAHGLGEGETI